MSRVVDRTTFTAVLALLAMIAAAVPALAHTPCDRVIESAVPALHPDLVEVLVGCLSESSRPVSTAPTRRPVGSSDYPSDWRPLVATYFPADRVDAALAVLWCESRGDPWATNPSSGAAGLYQHLPRYWADRASKAGWAGADIYDPTANVAVAAWLSAGGSDWSHWNASQGCWS